MPEPNTPPPASFAIGHSPCGLYGIPRVGHTTPGLAAIVIGTTPSGYPVSITTGSLEWLDDLESAIQIARAHALVASGQAQP